MKKLFLALLRWILGPKLAAGLEAGQSAYEAESEKEQAAAIEAQAGEIQRIEAEVTAKKDKAHEEVVSAADPDAVVNEQLRELGIIADDEGSAGGDAGATDAPAPADGKRQGG
jgi:hypothetical protein